jgi:hypothetical protein
VILEKAPNPPSENPPSESLVLFLAEFEKEFTANS